MHAEHKAHLLALVRKELLEYRLSMLWTPVLIAAALTALMCLSLLLSGYIAVLGDGFLERALSGIGTSHPSIVINIEHDEDVVGDFSGGSQAPPAAPPAPGEGLQAEPLEEPLPEAAWNFSREWRFEPDTSEKPAYERSEGGSLNPLFRLPHALLMMVMLLVSANYLLSCLFTDRRDRSVLFWKSMPVSEWHDVLVRMAMVLLVVPAIYIAISILLQLLLVLLSMLLVSLMGQDPWVQILENIEFGSLFLGEIGAWLMTALWIAPVYAWLLLASSWARRSPFLTAVAPVIGLVVAELLLFRSEHVKEAVRAHIPGFAGGSSPAGVYADAGYWLGYDWVGLLLGLLFAALAVVAAAFLRRYRFEE